MIYPDRKGGVRLVTDPPMPHREAGSQEAMVMNAPDEWEVYRESMRRANWRNADRELTQIVSQRLAREARGK